MPEIQGLLLCGGNGTRYAASVGAKPPYPKHLEMIADKSVLHRSAESMVANIGVTGITVTLNDQLLDQYLPELHKIQESHEDVVMSYSITSQYEEDLFHNLKKDLRRSIFDLRGNLVELNNPISAFAYGDAIIQIPRTDLLRNDISYHLSKLEDNKSIVVYIGDLWSSAVYQIDRLDNLSDYFLHSTCLRAHNYGAVQAWNINTIQELIIAKRDLGYSLNEDEELKIIPPKRYHKES